MSEEIVYFSRHQDPWQAADGTDILKWLWENERIGICYTGDGGWEEKNYNRAGKYALRHMMKLNSVPLVVVAAYPGLFNQYHESPRIRIGTSIPHSRAIFFNKIKSVALHIHKEVGIEDFPLPFLIPPPFYALVKWPSASRAVLAFLNDENIPIDAIESYTGWHLEVVAEEWLRTTGSLVRKYYKTGGSMKFFDLIGETVDGHPVLVQVKYKTKQIILERFVDVVEEVPNAVGYFIVAQPDGLSSPRGVRTTVVTLGEILSSSAFMEPSVRAWLRRLLSGNLLR